MAQNASDYSIILEMKTKFQLEIFSLLKQMGLVL